MKKLLIAALLAGSAFQGGVAVANHDCGDPQHLPADPTDCLAWFDCGFDTVAQETATGGQDTFTGGAYGYIVSRTPGNTVSIRCYVRVDGSEVDSTPTGTGTTVAATADQVTYTASDTQDVDLCAEWTDGANGGDVCFETTTTQIPPQEIIDLINSALDLLFTTLGPTLEEIDRIIAENTEEVDVILCTALKAAGVPGIFNLGTPIHEFYMDLDDCDIWDAFPEPDERVINFYPYDS